MGKITIVVDSDNCRIDQNTDGTELSIKTKNGYTLSCGDDTNTFALNNSVPSMEAIRNIVKGKQSVCPDNISFDERLEAIVDMVYVVEYLNGDWRPDFNNGEMAWYISKRSDGSSYKAWSANTRWNNIAYFKTKDDAQKAIDILGNKKLDLFFGYNDN